MRLVSTKTYGKIVKFGNIFRDESGYIHFENFIFDGGNPIDKTSLWKRIVLWFKDIFIVHVPIVKIENDKVFLSYEVIVKNK